MKRLLLGLALAGVCGGVCSAPYITGFEKDGVSCESENYCKYRDRETGAIWVGKITKAIPGVLPRRLDLVTQSLGGRQVLLWMSSNLKGSSQTYSTVTQYDFDCQKFAVQDEFTIFTNGYLGKGTVDLTHGGVLVPAPYWIGVKRDHPLYPLMWWNCGKEHPELPPP